MTFEQEDTEPPRKRACVVKSVPMTVGKKPPTVTKVARKSVPTAAAGKPSTSKQDPDYEPGEVGAGESDDDSDTEDVINPLIDQELYIYDCYAVDITDGNYNTKTSIKTCPTKDQCYCSQQFVSSDEFKTHEKKHARQAWTCFECDKKSKGNDKCAVYKHYRTQHKRRHLHQCTLTHAQLMATRLGMMNSTRSDGICRRTMVCIPPWGVQSVMGHFAANKASRNIFPLAQAKRINMAPNRHHMQRKSSDATSVQKIYH